MDESTIIFIIMIVATNAPIKITRHGRERKAKYPRSDAILIEGAFRVSLMTRTRTMLATAAPGLVDNCLVFRQDDRL